MWDEFMEVDESWFIKVVYNVNYEKLWDYGFVKIISGSKLE